MKTKRFIPCTLLALAGLMILPTFTQASPRHGGHGGGHGGGGWHGRGHGGGGPRIVLGIAPWHWWHRHDDYYYYDRDYYRGRAGNLEMDVQAALARRGYYRGPIDGDIGPGTRSAIRAYQYDKDLRVTGHIDSALIRALHL